MFCKANCSDISQKMYTGRGRFILHVWSPNLPWKSILDNKLNKTYVLSSYCFGAGCWLVLDVRADGPLAMSTTPWEIPIRVSDKETRKLSNQSRQVSAVLTHESRFWSFRLQSPKPVQILQWLYNLVSIPTGGPRGSGRPGNCLSTAQPSSHPGTMKSSILT